MKFRCCIFLLTLCSANLLAQEKPAPKIPETSFDLGDISEEGGRVYHVFHLENPGTDTLWLESAKGQCHCTTAKLVDGFIPPGKTGKIRVEYDTKGRPWDFDEGLNLKFKGNEKTELRLKGKIKPGKKNARFVPAEFTQTFDFNEKAIETGRQQFRRFVESMLPLLERHGVVNIQIESSASTVPTKAFASNEELTKVRAASARAEILQIIREAGAMEERLNFLLDNTIVQGPDYEQDYFKNPKDYEPFQYVKIRVF